MSSDLNIHEIILQLVKTDLAFKESDLSRLLPLNKVYPGFGFYSGIHKINFDPPEEYEKESYDIEVNVDDDKERIKQLTQLNDDIRKYNRWAAEKNRLHDDEFFQKLPPDSKARSGEEVVVESKWFPVMGEYQMWQFVTSKASPKKFRESYMEDLMTIINHEELFKTKEQMPTDEFISRFNKMIYEYLRIMINEAKELDSYDSDYLWYEPNMEFVRWFHNKGIIIGDIEPLFDVQKTNDFEEPNKGLSPNASWDEITISIIPSSNSPIPLISINSPEYNEIKTIDTFGFALANDIEKPNQLFETLYQFAVAGGRITSNSSVRVVETPVSRLRKHLKELFGIDAQPISNFTKAEGYKCEFHIHDESQSEMYYDEIKKNINKSQFRNQDALQHTDDIEIDPETGEPKFPE